MSSDDLLTLVTLLDEYMNIPGTPDEARLHCKWVISDVIEAYKQSLTTKLRALE